VAHKVLLLKRRYCRPGKRESPESVIFRRLMRVHNLQDGAPRFLAIA
jgi:hypothetical protein